MYPTSSGSTATNNAGTELSRHSQYAPKALQRSFSTMITHTLTFAQMAPVARQERVLARCLLLLCTLGLGLFAGAQEATFITFDPPGSTGTQVNSINPAGAITGYYFEGNNSHGFLRARGGTFTTFDGPGAAFTLGTSINPAGAITGSYFDASSVQHGFLRSR